MERTCTRCGNILPGGAAKCSLCGAEIQPSSSDIESLLIDGRKIDAIKLYREEKKVGLKEAKDAVERVEVQLRTQGRLPQVSGRGCVVLFAGVLSVVLLSGMILFFS